MKRAASIVMMLLFLGVLTPAQSPRGWMLRADRSTSASDPDAPGAIKFVTAGSGFHATNPQAAVFWNPADTIAGSYSVKGTFTLVRPSNHTNYYGLVFGGRDLEGAAQSYVYFLVAQDGTWLVKRREGEVTQTVLPKTASDAVNKPDATGRSINDLEVRVSPTAITFIVNGTVVNTWFDAARAVKTDGIYGMRVNHFLDVEIDRFAASQGSGDTAVAAGGPVAVTAQVAQVISPTAFLVHRDAGAGGDLLVVAPALQRPVDPGGEVTVVGDRTTFEPQRLARNTNDSGPAVPAGVAEKFQGRPAIVAANVLDAKMVDLTKKLPPPMTPDEVTLSGVMKRVSPAFDALRQAIGGSNAAAARQNAAVLAQAFVEAEALWKSRARADAVGWAQEAHRQAESIDGSAAAGKWDAARSAADTMGQQCQACHNTYRERFDDGSFRIKAALK